MRNDPPENFDFKKLEQDQYHHWHLSWELFPGVKTPGNSSVAGLMAGSGLPDRLDGLRVADIGAWNGCVAFECERRGARDVVAMSLEDPETSGFNFLKQVLEAERTRYERRSIYDLNPADLGLFDVVICFGVLYHLRYPVLGIDNLRRIARGTLYVETQVLDNAFIRDGKPHQMEAIGADLSGDALLQFYPGKELEGGASNWFSPSMAALRGLLDTAGFDVVSASTNVHRGYMTAKVRPGLPPFLSKIEGDDTYEGLFYDLSFSRLYGPRNQWER